MPRKFVQLLTKIQASYPARKNGTWSHAFWRNLVLWFEFALTTPCIEVSFYFSCFDRLRTAGLAKQFRDVINNIENSNRR